MTKSIGAFNSYNVSGATSYRAEDWYFLLSGEYQHFGDDNNRVVQHDLQSTLDSIFATNASLAPGRINNGFEQFTINGKFKWQNLSINYFTMSGDFGFGGGVANSLDPHGYGEQDLQTIKFDYNLSDHIVGEMHLSAWYKYQYSVLPFTIFPAGTVLPLDDQGNLIFTNITTFATFSDGYIGHPGNKDKQFHVNLTRLYQLNTDHKIRWEFGAERQLYSPFEHKNFGPSIFDGTKTLVDGTLYCVTDSPIYMLIKQIVSLFFFRCKTNGKLMIA